LFFRLGSNGKSLVVETKLVVEMKSNNTIAPYEFKRVNGFALSTLMSSEDFVMSVLK